MIHHGDLFDVLPTLAPDSVDCGITDPPYGIGFMGKEWDVFRPSDAPAITTNRQAGSANPNLKNRQRAPATSTANVEYNRSVQGQREFQSWCERWAREVYRVLKPGAYLLVSGAPRGFHRMAVGVEDAGFEIRDCLSWLFGSGFPKSLNLPGGIGTALKPGWEPIFVARKPLIGTVVENLAAHGTGGFNIDAARLELDGEPLGAGAVANEDGRWPPNVAIDAETAELLDEHSGELMTGQWPSVRNGAKFERVYGGFKDHQTGLVKREANRGGASRFYYVSKPSRSERERGCHELPQRQRDDSRKDGNPGGDNPRNRGLQRRGNSHPTVKPVDLIRWLIRLAVPPGGIVLDPFMGSGTTGMACALEGRQFIGVEREAEYVAIAERRISSSAPLLSPEASA